MKNERAKSAITFPLLDAPDTKKEPVTHQSKKDGNGDKIRVTTIFPGNPGVGEEFPKTDVQYFGQEVKIKCVQGVGCIFTRNFERDNEGKVIPDKIVSFGLDFLDENSNAPITLTSDQFWIIQNTGTIPLIIEQHGINVIPEVFPCEDPSIWPDDSDYMNARNIGLPVYTRGENGFPSAPSNMSHGKNVEQGKLFSKN